MDERKITKRQFLELLKLQSELIVLLFIRGRRLRRQRKERYRLKRKQARLRRRLQRPYREPVPTIPYFDPGEGEVSQDIQDDNETGADETPEDDSSNDDESRLAEQESGEVEVEATGSSVTESDRITKVKRDICAKCDSLGLPIETWLQHIGMPQLSTRVPKPPLLFTITFYYFQQSVLSTAQDNDLYSIPSAQRPSLSHRYCDEYPISAYGAVVMVVMVVAFAGHGGIDKDLLGLSDYVRDQGERMWNEILEVY
ncbi:MAG: hypothetical protein M1836_002482 [Candelina mexicana]|nr:MAG: hypothetical protein M1836_002482 [Candelina mexicana]